MSFEDEWNAKADGIIALNPGDDPVSVMVRASWAFTKTVPVPTSRAEVTDEYMSMQSRKETESAIAALEHAGYQIVQKSHQ